MTWVLSETALRSSIGGPDLMREQLRKILTVTAAPHLHLQILPLAVGEHPSLDGSFSIIDIGSDDPMSVVAVHSLVRSWFIDEPVSVDYYERVYGALSTLALTETESRVLIDQIASEL
ncbi:hypothetical protein E1293_43705 [Actinomadura darangshiensis]|uniref:DUF5753 domain-containing protein n=1 Tax=Actinomadura darangshiensis TaxID=705336 RepID=A0A4R4ZWP9_9ACTN|nr:DUF5753 domain-containing protein [Actinomadura darangshiensis]TDD62786.1 hypothetical protein E1293_43705 [Actinomadura darangshiensis]